MDENNAAAKVTGIRQIVRLKEILHRWQTVTIGSKSENPQIEAGQQAAAMISPAINKRLLDIKNADSDEESCQSPEPPPDVPEGYLAVYVGPELRRFIIPTNYLSHPLFKLLLDKVEEEFGFDQSGALTIPCEVETFKYLLKCMENNPGDHYHPDHGSGGDAKTAKEE